MEHEHPNRIASRSKEGGVPQGKKPGMAINKIEARGKDSENKKLGANALHVRWQQSGQYAQDNSSANPWQKTDD
jgi:hypothetical protein